MTVCHILREDPELAEAVPRAARSRAIETCVARTATVASPGAAGAIGLLVLDGVLLRRVGVDGRFGAELLGQGDLLRPWQEEDGSAALTRTTGWRVLESARLAVLDEAAARRLAAYPELTGRLVAPALDRGRPPGRQTASNP